MSTIVTRAAKGSALTHNEVDANFVNLNTDKYQSGDNASLGTITSSALTSGRVTFASTGGLLADSASLVWDNTNARLGIGTASPTDKLEVTGSGTTYITAVRTSANNSRMSVGAGSGQGAIVATDSSGTYLPITSYAEQHIWSTSGATERMRINSAGNVGIGTASPGGLLSIASAASDTWASSSGGGLTLNGTGASTGISTISTWLDNSAIRIGSGVSVKTGILITGSTTATIGSTIQFSTGGAERMRIDSAGNVGIGVTPSAWRSTQPTIQAGTASFGAYNNILANFAQNMYVDSSNVERYITSTWATQYYQYLGTHAWRTAPIGTAGAAITFTQAMTLTSGGDLGVGTADPTGGYAYNSATRIIGVSGDGTASTAAYGVLNLDNNRATPSATDALGLVSFTSSNSVAGQTLKAYIAGFNSGSGGITGGFGGYLGFYTKADNSASLPPERMRIASTGELLVGITSVVSGGANLQVSDGITFPATAVASANANTLDDYEEGTFTPTVVGTSTAGTGTYINQVGRYTKIGNRVCFTVYLNWTAHTGTGNIRISGLPFSSLSTTASYHALSIWNTNITLTASNLLMAYVNVNAITIEIQQYPTGGGASAAVAMDTSGAIMLTGHYEV